MRPPEDPAPAAFVPPAAPAAAPDPWTGLRRFTAARIALGRSGGSQRTGTVLDFRLAHARARDAVQAAFDPAAFAARIEALGLPVAHLATAATDRRSYLLRPDLGRKLAPASRERLLSLAPAWGRRDLALIVSDGLAARATEHAVETISRLVGILEGAGWTLHPVLIIPFARVKVQDEIGEILGARHTLLLLGERPGLGTPDSLGAYFTHLPGPARTDADRNCVSNIRPEGLPPAAAANKLAWLLRESARREVGGVALKDEQPAVAMPPS